MLLWFAGVRLACVIVTGCLILLYFLTSCSRSGFNVNAYMDLNLDQCWVLILLFLCVLYNEPFFELRRNNPSTSLAILAEIPASAFFTALLTYWLLSVTYVRIKEKNLHKRPKKQEINTTKTRSSNKYDSVSLADIIGVLSIKRLLALVILLCSFVAVQTMLHLRYLTIETDRAMFSSFTHFETSEDLHKDPVTVLLIVANAAFGLFYAILYIFEVIRSFLAFRRLQFS